MPMNVEQTLVELPPESVFRKLIPDLLGNDETTWEAAYKQLRNLDHLGSGENPLAANWKYTEREALTLLRAAVELPFPPPRYEWKDSVHDLIFLTVRSPYQSLVQPAIVAYPKVSDRAKSAILSLLGACGSLEAAEGFLSCIRNYGWPDATYARVFSELPKLLDHADIIFPELIERAGNNVGGVTDVFVTAIAKGKLDFTGARTKLETISPFVIDQLTKALKVAAEHQCHEGTAWRFTENYWYVRQHTGSWLDIAGYLKDRSVAPLLEDALRLDDPKLLAFTAASILRRGGNVSEKVLHRIAACHETRDSLYEMLRNLERADLFPQALQTWDAFAASNMVHWLLYPAELGREPDQIEQMAVFTSNKPDGELALYVWRFRCDDGPWYAGVSGPYLREGSPAPLHGDLTFSCFAEWDTATAEQHAQATLQTLEEWRTAKVF